MADRLRSSSPRCGRRKSKTTIGCRARRSKRSRKHWGCPTSACWRSPLSTRCSISSPWGNITCSFAARRPACCAAPTTSSKSLNAASARNGKSRPTGYSPGSSVECLGACCNAPIVQIDDDYYEDLTPETLGSQRLGQLRLHAPRGGDERGALGGPDLRVRVRGPFGRVGRMIASRSSQRSAAGRSITRSSPRNSRR